MASRIARFAAFALLLLAVASCFGGKSTKTLRLATTTSVQDSGLLPELLAAFEKKHGYRVETHAVGSGKALEQLRAGDADVAITHAPDDEQQAVSAGNAARRTPFMHNEFVIVGPKDDGATLVAGAGDFRDALKKIAASGRKFISRGDGSGTHARERALWKAAGLADDASFIVPAKAGMAETLAMASDKDAFALTDRGTFIARRDDLDLAIVFQGDDELRNVYSVIEPAGRTDSAGARALAEFVRSPEGRSIIGGFGVKSLGEPLFSPQE